MREGGRGGVAEGEGGGREVGREGGVGKCLEHLGGW